MAELDWTEQARCRGKDPDQFFQRGVVRSRGAIRVCERCPVKNECLEYALEHDVDFGVWGGLTDRQRRAHQRRSLAEAV